MLSGTPGSPYTPPVTRRTIRATAIGSAVVAVLGVVVGALLGEVVWALFGVLGLGLGLLNHMLGVLAMTNFTASQPSRSRFVGSVLVRLLAISVIAVGCALLFRPVGFGVFVGLVVFQLVAMASSLPPLIKEVRRG